MAADGTECCYILQVKKDQAFEYVSTMLSTKDPGAVFALFRDSKLNHIVEFYACDNCREPAAGWSLASTEPVPIAEARRRGKSLAKKGDGRGVAAIAVLKQLVMCSAPVAAIVCAVPVCDDRRCSRHLRRALVNHLLSRPLSYLCYLVVTPEGE